MKKLLPLVIVFLIISIFFTPFFLRQKLPIPSDSLVGLYYPFRDFFAKDYPRGIPFKNFLITDPVRQQYEWRFLSSQIEKMGSFPIWNPYNGTGMPLFANQQSAVLNPLNILFFIFPFAISWSFQIYLTLVLASLSMYLYLKQLRLSSASSIFASISFAFSGFMVVWLEWNTVAQSFLWLPFVLLLIEKLFSERKHFKRVIWIILISLALAFSFFAGHIQTFFYVGLLSFAYFLLKIISLKNERREYAIYFISSVCLLLVFSMIQIIPTMQLIQLSARSVDVNWKIVGWFIPYQNLIQFFVPDFFGNPSTLNYWGVWNYAELVGYIGIAPLLFACIGGLFTKRKIVYFFIGVILLSLLFATSNPISALPFVLQIPFLSTSQPTRLLSLVDFSLIILAAFGMDSINRLSSKNLYAVIGIFSFVFISLWGYLFIGNKIIQSVTPENILVAERNSLLPTGLFVISAIILIISHFLKNKKIVMLCLVLFIGLSAYDGIYFANKFTPFTPQTILFPQTKTLSFLQKKAGTYRYMTTDDGILPPNVSAYYHIYSLDVYDPLYLQRYGEFIAAMGRGRPSIAPPFGFNRIITPHAMTSPFIDLLGVKYIISLDSINEPSVKKVFEEGQTKVYENMKVFPRTFFVREILPAISKEQAIEKMYEEATSLQTKAIVEGFSERKVLSVGESVIQQYLPNKIVLQTQNSGDGFIVLTDMYYPTWHAFIDGNETKIYTTDYIFRGIFVPKGKHTIAFTVALL